MRRLVVSFSGGRTSGYMTKRILDAWQDQYDEIIVLFANTGQEHEKTLEFVNNCDKHFGFNAVWLEAAVDPEKGVGTKYTVTNYLAASRAGAPFEAVIAKYGIPNLNMFHCTRELKLQPMKAYLRSIGWDKNDTAIGIRVDEIDRMSATADSARIVYPLVKWGITKRDVLSWWRKQPFDLDIPEHYGNCLWCWKKSDRKLFTLAKEHPEWFEFPARMEAEYGTVGAAYKKYGVPQTFFRKYRGAGDIIASSKGEFTPYSEQRLPTFGEQQLELDISNGCTESCEVNWEESADE